LSPRVKDLLLGLLFFLPALALGLRAERYRPPLPAVSDIREVRRSAAEDAAAVSLGARRLFADVWFIRLMQYYGTRESVHDERIQEHREHHHADGSVCDHGPGWEKGEYPEFIPLSLHVIDLDPWFHSAVIYSAASLAYNLNKPADARTILELAISRAPREWRYHSVLAALGHSGEENPGEIVRLLLPVVRQPDCPTMLKNQTAFLSKRAGDYSTAAEIYRDIAENAPEKEYAERALRELEKIEGRTR
jgi:tetratricopeptide (TPR) repeat protein